MVNWFIESDELLDSLSNTQKTSCFRPCKWPQYIQLKHRRCKINWLLEVWRIFNSSKCQKGKISSRKVTAVKGSTAESCLQFIINIIGYHFQSWEQWTSSFKTETFLLSFKIFAILTIVLTSVVDDVTATFNRSKSLT